MQEGVVIKSTGSWYEVRNDSGEVVLCRLRGKIRLDGIRTTNPISVGDKVLYEKENNKDTCVINKILPRHNVIVRKSVNLSKASHIIASNIDQAILVATIAQPRTSTGFIDRFLVTAEAYHIPTTIVFNKCDLYDEEQMAQAEELISTFENIGYKSFMISAKTGYRCDELKEIMKDKVSLFSGHSVGVIAPGRDTSPSFFVSRITSTFVSVRSLMFMKKENIRLHSHRCSLSLSEVI